MSRFAELNPLGADLTEFVRVIKVYLPNNYRVIYGTEERVIISGEDSCGWTLDDYVIPRLASGLYFATEITLADVPANNGNSYGFNV